uniref:Uncharacterized protein n=1 Tax=Picea glauca TaxID=3330 RepID=A0A117NIG3_PICGL|nr:hypothetical protein ABT39_MTgene3110 [Picea glauca]QHR86474.1 hypothetical protein Q903MT_gene474 [Picea sitchensis]
MLGKDYTPLPLDLPHLVCVFCYLCACGSRCNGLSGTKWAIPSSKLCLSPGTTPIKVYPFYMDYAYLIG